MRTIRIASLVIALSAIGLNGCKKDTLGNTKYEEPKPDNSIMKYKLEGLTGMTVEQTGKQEILLQVKHISGRQEDVELAISGMPNGVVATFLPASTARAPFDAYLRVTANKATPGSYPLVVSTTTSASGTVTYDAVLTIVPYSNPAMALEGIFTESHNCSVSGSNSFDVSIKTDANVTKRIIINGFWTGINSNAIYADINPDNGSLTIPTQEVNSVNFSGSGSYTENQLTINYTVTGPGVNDNCTATFNRK